MKEESRIRFLAIFVTVIIFVLGLYVVMGAVPLAPQTFDEIEDSILDPNDYGAQTHDAYAGNITALEIFAVAQTKHWQGYFGNITGTITLDDADGFTLYDWPNDEPKGEIYATANSTTPGWSTATCFNMSDVYTGPGNLSQWERFYNMTYNDVDGINETFNMTSHPTFDIGDVRTISSSDGCPSTYTHVSDTFQSDKFVEVLLHDSEGRLILTSIIENDDEGNNTDVIGYKGGSFRPDFQLIVPEDGTSRDGGGDINTATTLYYFYLDLE